MLVEEAQRILNGVIIKHNDSRSSLRSRRSRRRSEYQKGIIKKSNNNTRSYASYVKWRRDVLSRDGKCIICGEIYGLEAHHIESFHQSPELREDVSNGVTFCHGCHKQFHKLYGRKRNNLTQYITFVDLEQTI